MLKKFVTQRGRDEVAAWYARLTDGGQAHVDNRLRYLAGATRQWSVWVKDVGFKNIVGKGLGEIKVKADNVQYRLIGFRGPESGDFTVVLVTDKKAAKLRNSTWNTAQKRRKLVENDKSLAHEWNI